MSEPAVQTANPVTAQPSGALSRDRSNSELATLASKLDKSSTAIDAIGCAPSLTGQVAIVTGGNGGVGKAAALALAAGGAHVIIGCRSLSRGAAAAKEMNELLESDSVWPTVQVGGLVLGSKRRAAEQGRVEVMELDVSSLDSVRAFVAAGNHWVATQQHAPSCNDRPADHLTHGQCLLLHRLDTSSGIEVPSRQGACTRGLVQRLVFEQACCRKCLLQEGYKKAS